MEMWHFGLCFSGVLATGQFSIIKDKWERTVHSDTKEEKPMIAALPVIQRTSMCAYTGTHTCIHIHMCVFVSPLKPEQTHCDDDYIGIPYFH